MVINESIICHNIKLTVCKYQNTNVFLRLDKTAWYSQSPNLHFLNKAHHTGQNRQQSHSSGIRCHLLCLRCEGQVFPKPPAGSQKILVYLAKLICTDFHLLIKFVIPIICEKNLLIITFFKVKMFQIHYRKK